MIASSEPPASSSTRESIAGLDAPRQPARDALGRDFRGEAAELAVVLALDGIEREPAGGAGAAVRAAPRLAVEQQAGEDLVADVEADRVARAARRADPLTRRPSPRRRACSAVTALMPATATSGLSLGAGDAGDRPAAWTARRAAHGVAAASSPAPARDDLAAARRRRRRGRGRSERSRPRLSIDVPLHLAPLERQRARVRRPEQSRSMR